MTEAVAVREDLRTALGKARRHARPGQLVSAATRIGECDAARAFHAVRAAGQDAALWLRPDDGTTLLAVGSAATLTARGRDRILGLRRAWSELRASAPDATGLRAFVGVSFDQRSAPAYGPSWEHFPSALLVLPRLLIGWREGRVLARATARADDASADRDLERIWTALASASGGSEAAPAAGERIGELPSRQSWRADVVRARDEIRRGYLDKVVLARAVRLRLGAGAPEAAVSFLAGRSPGCTVYAVGRGSSLLLGATPESLVHLAGGIARVSCVAGTAPRADADAETALGLLQSEKDREEHALVVRAARRALEPLCDRVTASGSPRLMALATLWHLASEVRGAARPGVELLDLAAALHPTPAVCGSPRATAMRVLAAREPFDRGWYGGALGWVDERGDGELVVALRGALATPDDAWLFAGCGIVAGSDPESELAESELKLRPMLEALRVA